MECQRNLWEIVDASFYRDAWQHLSISAYPYKKLSLKHTMTYATPVSSHNTNTGIACSCHCAKGWAYVISLNSLNSMWSKIPSILPKDTRLASGVAGILIQACLAPYSVLQSQDHQKVWVVCSLHKGAQEREKESQPQVMNSGTGLLMEEQSHFAIYMCWRDPCPSPLGDGRFHT